jgi:excisionase family DNA binding protein
MTTTQAAVLAGTTRFTVEREIKRGHLAAQRTGRIWSIDRAEAERWAASFVPYAGLRVPRHSPSS